MPITPPTEKTQTRILIVEDDKAVYSPISLLLTHYEFSVTIATTLAEARTQSQKRPDLIVLDIMLPDGSGLDLLEEIRRAGRNTRVFILTGNTLPETDRKIRRLVPNKHFRKPFNFFEILNAIRNEFPEAQSAGRIPMSLSY